MNVKKQEKVFDVLYLCFTEAETSGHLVPFWSGQIFAMFELFLKLQKLLRGEGCAGPTSLAEQRMRIACRVKEKIRCHHLHEHSDLAKPAKLGKF